MRRCPDDVLLGKVAHAARQLQLTAGDGAGVGDGYFVPSHVQYFDERDFIAVHFDILQFHFARLAAAFRDGFSGNFAAVLLQGVRVFLRSDLSVKFGIPDAAGVLSENHA